MAQTATKNGKWFYQYQDEIRKRIESANYSRYGYILYQMEADNKYIECWDVQHNETGKCEQVIATVNKVTGFIFFYTSANKF